VVVTRAVLIVKSNSSGCHGTGAFESHIARAIECNIRESAEENIAAADSYFIAGKRYLTGIGCNRGGGGHASPNSAN